MVDVNSEDKELSDYESVEVAKRSRRFGIGVSSHGSLIRRDGGYFEEEQPIRLKVHIGGNPFKAVNIGQNDWYNMFKFYIKQKKINRGVWGEKKEINIRVIQRENLIEGKLRPEEKKEILIEIMDILEGGYSYQLYAEITLQNGLTLVDGAGFRVIKSVTPEQKNDLAFRKGEVAFYDKDYNLAAEYYKRVFENGGVYYIPKLAMLIKLSDAYEKGSDYTNAKKYLLELAKYYEKEMNESKKRYEEWLLKSPSLFKKYGYSSSLTYDEFVNKVHKKTGGNFFEPGFESELAGPAIRWERAFIK